MHIQKCGRLIVSKDDEINLSDELNLSTELFSHPIADYDEKNLSNDPGNAGF